MKFSILRRLFTGFSAGLIAAIALTGFVAGSAFAEPLVSATFLPSGDEIVIYVGDGCPHCANLEAHVENEGYDEIFDIEFKEVYHDPANAKEMGQVSDYFGIGMFERGVPLTVTSTGYFMGDKLAADFLDDKYDAWILANSGAEDPGDSGSGSGSGGFDPSTTNSEKQLTIPLLIGAALVDAVNPCAFAVLIILLTTILAGGVKRRALYSGLLFSLAIFLSYLAMGLGLYKAISSVGVSLWFMKFIGALAIVLGLFNLKDVFFYGKGFVMEVPFSWRPKMKAFIKGVTNPIGAFFIGILISMFLLPCTSGPYIVIISLLGQDDTFWHAVRLLVLYNVIFITPMVFITLAVYKGFSVERAEEMRQKRLKALHLIAGVILLIMGVVILMGYV
jgi:cytochrome c biogenesis protein CcdA